MHLPHWLRVYMSHLDCSVVVLDALWICAALHPDVTRALLARQLGHAVVVLRPTTAIDGNLVHCASCHSKCRPDQGYTCLATPQHYMTHIDQEYRDALSVFTPYDQPPAPLLHPGVWLQRALELATETG